jgi:hypothetical protein
MTSEERAYLCGIAVGTVIGAFLVFAAAFIVSIAAFN